MEGFVSIGLGEADVILEFARNGLPKGVNNPKGFIAFLDGVDDDPEGGEIVNLVKIDILGVHLLIDTVYLLGATRHFGLNLVFE